jgi:hypothetical protein
MKKAELEKNILDLEYQTYRSRTRLLLGLIPTLFFGIFSLGDLQDFLLLKIGVSYILTYTLAFYAYRSLKSMTETKEKIIELKDGYTNQ